MNLESTSNKTEQIERELRDLIIKYKLQDKINLNKIKEWVYEATDNDPSEAFKLYMGKFESLFVKVKKGEEYKKIASVFVDAWNHFPHKDLGDLSPRQKIEMQNNNQTDMNFDFTEIVIPFEMTAILSLKAKLLGITLREYMLFILAKHIEESLKDGKGLMDLLFPPNKETKSEVRYLSIPKSRSIKKSSRSIKRKKN